MIFSANGNIFELSYPFVEVLTGLLDLFPHQNYYPLFVHILKAMNYLSDKTKTNIPVASFVHKILKNKNFVRRFANAKAKEFDFEISFRCSKEHCENNKFWDDLLKQLSFILLKSLSIQLNAPFFDSYSKFVRQILKKLYTSRTTKERKIDAQRTVK